MIFWLTTTSWKAEKLYILLVSEISSNVICDVDRSGGVTIFKFLRSLYQNYRWTTYYNE